MNKVDWKPIFVNGDLHPDLHVGNRVLIYKTHDRYFGESDKKTLIEIGTLNMWQSVKQYY